MVESSFLSAKIFFLIGIEALEAADMVGDMKFLVMGFWLSGCSFSFDSLDPVSRKKDIYINKIRQLSQ